ncbi:MAG: hypothetical protein CUN56_09440 [Phototrophicales bacterium]|nr:MAG: hypothetical protein CUN56_09440 [Phototrophicales bacterium]RMG72349.1 MAG: DNA-processing protein DprA [Chloroflexota bacterium]
MYDPRWVALSLCLGGKTFHALLTHFQQDLDAVFAADEATLRQVRGIGLKTAHAILKLDLNQIARRIEHWMSYGVQIVTWHDPLYPRRLKALEDAPPTLFYLGTLAAVDQHPAYAVVGTRSPSSVAAVQAAQIGGVLAHRGDIVVSGLALGVDKLAHTGALSVQQGLTCAVLGSGILNVYPQQNQALAQAIISRNGALICEVAPDAPVSTPGLVARNRLIIGMSQALIVVETGIEGGAMHTVRFAKQQNKPIYTLPLQASGNQAILNDGGLDISLLYEHQ